MKASGGPGLHGGIPTYPGMDYPGFAAGTGGAPTTLEQQDMKLLGVSSRQSYSGVHIEITANDGPTGGVQWTGFVTAGR